MASDLDGVQLIISWRSFAVLPFVAIVLVAGCRGPVGSPQAGIVADKSAEVRADDKTILAVSQIQQETLLCVPTSAAMVLAYYGDPQPPRRLKVLASGGLYDPNVPFNDFSVTPYRDLVRGVQSLGYSWAEQDYPNTETGFTDGLALIESEVRNGEPVMVDVSEPQGHTVVIGGFDKPGRRLLAVDPGVDTPGQHWISYDTFETIWNERAYGGNFRALIRTQPRTTS